MQQLTVEERKWEISKVDEEAAKKRLEDTAKKRKKDTPGQYYEPGTLQQGSDPNLPPPKNLVKPTVVSKEDVDLGRVIMTKDGYRETDWYTKQKEEVTKTTQKRKKVEKKTTTKKRNTLEDLKYKLAGPSGRAKMIEEGYVPK